MTSRNIPNKIPIEPIKTEPKRPQTAHCPRSPAAPPLALRRLAPGAPHPSASRATALRCLTNQRRERLAPACLALPSAQETAPESRRQHWPRGAPTRKHKTLKILLPNSINPKDFITNHQNQLSRTVISSNSIKTPKRNELNTY